MILFQTRIQILLLFLILILFLIRLPVLLFFAMIYVVAAPDDIPEIGRRTDRFVNQRNNDNPHFISGGKDIMMIEDKQYQLSFYNR